MRRPGEELAVLQEIEEALCTPEAIVPKSAVFERHNTDRSDGLTRNIFGYLHNMAAIACIDIANLSVLSFAIVYGSNDALAVMTKDAHTMLRIYLVVDSKYCVSIFS